MPQANPQIPVGQPERATQNRVVALFRDELHYDYLGNWHTRPANSNIEEPLLRDYLHGRGYSEPLITRALHVLKSAARNPSHSLYNLNQEVYGLLRYGVPVAQGVGQNTVTVALIDWAHPAQNHFALAEEVTITGANDKRPDLVLYVNGLALGVLELKRSTVSVSEGIRQNLDNQTDRFIKPFFATVQLIMAGNDTQGLRYGVTETPEKYYLKWQEENVGSVPPDQRPASRLDADIMQLCRPERFLEMVHDFIVFDGGNKKICRYNQYFGVKAAQKSLKKREGGIIWHTQGSGKSLTMVWLAKWIKENIARSRVLIVTDRKELDEQIEGVFRGVGETIYRTTSGADLIQHLNTQAEPLLCALIHKFGRKDKTAVESFAEAIKNSLPLGFAPKGDLYVFLDECHRTQSGKLHQALRTILPHAVMIGFTGTPLLAEDKQRTIEVFGSYLHTYKYDQAVRDNVVLDLRYEARRIEQHITSQAKIDKWFAAKTKGLTEHAQGELKQKWATMQNVLSSQDRLEQIANDIILDLATKPRLASGRGNAMLVAGSIYEACRFWEIFQRQGLTRCAVVTSYNPSVDQTKGETTGEDAPTDNLKKYEIYQKMLGRLSVEDYEKEAKRKFVKEPAQMRLLIVVDKLLTGFDAPSATYLYLDKSMRDHGLFQAICRVNRLDGEDKEYGYIVDYKDLFKNLEKSVTDYTAEAFAAFDQEDIAGLLSHRLHKAKERLQATLEAVRALCEPVAPPTTPAYLRYFCGDPANPDDLPQNAAKRLDLYKYTASLIRAYAHLAGEMPEAGFSATEIADIKREVAHYTKVRDEVKLASDEYIDLKAYEPAMRQLIDMYIGAEESAVLSAFENMSLVQLLITRGQAAVASLPSSIRQSKAAVAETIENNLRRLLVKKEMLDPVYYQQMSRILAELIQDRQARQLEYEEYLARIVALARQIEQPQDEFPAAINTPAQRALYHNTGHNAELALALHNKIMSTKKANFRGSEAKIREVKGAIYGVLREFGVTETAEVERLYKIVEAQKEEY